MMTYKQTIIAALMAASIIPTQASEDYIRGSKFASLCDNPLLDLFESEKNSQPENEDMIKFLSVLQGVPFCSAYITGFLDGWTFSQPEELKKYQVCLPEAVTSPQVVKITLKYIKNNPEREHEWVGDLIPDALIQAFPCSDDD